MLLALRTARSTKLPEAVPATCAGIVVAAAPLAAAITKPAVLKVVLQLLAAAQPLPLGQHWRALAAVVCSAESVTVTAVPLAAAGWLRVVLATPLALKLSVVAPSVPALAASIAVWPASDVAALVQGLELLLQAVTVTLLGRQARLVLASTSS